MPTRLKFLGAAQNVTGSKYLLETNDARVLVDCGLFQERNLTGRNWERFPVSPETIDALLLTHAHLDHCGLLPKLVREGFHSKIHCTAATAEISEIVLMDSAHLQEEDAEFKRKRHEREGRKGPHPEIPLYTEDDARAVVPLLSPLRYKEAIPISDGIEATFYDAGHILGSSMVKVKVNQNGQERTIVFSGDIGRQGGVLLHDPTFFDNADYVVIESTYGNRTHEDTQSVEDGLSEVINYTQKAGGNIVVPSFALERAQELLYHLNQLLIKNRIPHLMVFVDSPMATSVTEVFERYPELLNDKMAEFLNQKDSLFDFRGLKFVRTIDESKAINHIKGTVIIIAGSGMCTGGKIKHHLVQNITRPESTILFVGYQAAETLGRQITDGFKKVRILGQTYPVRARVVRMDGFSAHADRDELFKWISNLRSPPRHVFVTHGESDSAQSFANLISEKKGWRVSVPAYQDEVILD